LPDEALFDRCSGFRPNIVAGPPSTKHALRARPWAGPDLDTEISGHDRLFDVLSAQASPTLRDGYRIGATRPLRC
jgi:hypothetical protein